MDMKKMFQDLRAVQMAREAGRIQVVLNVQVIEQLSDMQGGEIAHPATALREVWPARNRAGRHG